jgi:DNA-binding transcriptional LysR family regulator
VAESVKMDLRQLRYFVALAEEGHFGRAADSLNIAQPPLSQQIKALESDLRVTLFDRSHRPIQLTLAGHTLLREARLILAQMERAEAATKLAAKGEGGRLSIGITGTAVLEFAVPVLSAFSKRRPNVSISLREMSSPAQLEALEKGEIHIGFVRPPVTDDRFSITLVHQEPFLVALPSTHPKADAPAVRLADLNGTALVIFDRAEAPGFRDLILHVCRSAGYVPTAIQDAPQMSTILCLVGSGFGMALVPRSTTRLALEGVVFKPLIDDSPPIELYAAWLHNTEAHLVDDLISCIKDSVKIAG